ncbi:MAG: transcriptional regulator NrdR [Dehalococcoidales bacterium]|jgi:transcriptional repressor NrdR|nr:transcriptional regulator NrdR [Dehalococcoidales bacterium]
MKCPYCEHPDSRVIDSRESSEGIRRRRQCISCSQRFTTYERLQPVVLYVVKKDQRREEFSKEKLLSGLRKACEKRPLPVARVEQMAEEIEADLLALGKAEISSSIIGDMVMEKLKMVDKIAYIRFASVYRDFTDIDALKSELEALK